MNTTSQWRDDHAVVFLGCGWATRMHSRTLAKIAPRLPRFYASRDRAKALEYCGRYAGAGWFDSYESALDDARPRIVIIGTPPATHLPLTFSGLAADKHVIVEKPAFLHARDCDLVRHAARAAQRRVFVAENYHYKPLAERLRAIVKEGQLGEIRLLHINAMRARSVEGWRADTCLSGGGALFEGGVHWVSLMASIGLDVESATGRRLGAREGLDLSWLVTLEYSGGATGVLFYSWEIPSPLRGLRCSRIYGTAGSAMFETNGLIVVEMGRRRRLVMPGLSDICGYGAMFRDFLGAISADREPRYTLEHARRDLSLVEEMHQTDELAFK